MTVDPLTAADAAEGPKVLVVCRNRMHMADVKRALRMEARYEVLGAPLAGLRFDRILAFYPDAAGYSSAEWPLIKEWLDLLRTKLREGGEVFYI